MHCDGADGCGGCDGCGGNEEPSAGLLVDGGDGRYFLIAWADLRRFLVPRPYQAVLTELTRGGEVGAEILGYGSEAAQELPENSWLLLSTVLAGLSSAAERLAMRRLSTWVLLR